jgi:hypothetical protein
MIGHGEEDDLEMSEQQNINEVDISFSAGTNRDGQCSAEDSRPGFIPADAISAFDHTLDKLYKQHRLQMHKHIEQARDNHYGLSDIFNDPTFPTVLGSPGVLQTERLAQKGVASAAQWRETFCGILLGQQDHSGLRDPMNVCIHKDEVPSFDPQVAYDVDSFPGFAKALAFTQHGLLYQPVPLTRQNITTDMHLETHVFPDSHDTGRGASLAILRDVPHFSLGRVVGGEDVAVHVLFPHMVSADAKFVSLTQNHLSRWLDGIFHPAVYRFYGAHYTQHLPGSYSHSFANSKARQVEGRGAEIASYQAKRCISYHLQPQHLNQIWTEVLNTINTTPGLADFRDPQLFFSAKGTKLRFKSSQSHPTMLGVMASFQSYLQGIIDLDSVHLDRFYVDIGKETCHSAGQPVGERIRGRRSGHVYL